MSFQRLSPTAARWLGATALATVLVIAPVTITIEGPTDTAVLAKGGGGGGGGGNGGGGDRGGGDRGGGDRGGGDRGGGDKGGHGGGHADKGDKGDRGDKASPGNSAFGHDVASRAKDLDHGRGQGSFGRDVASRARDLDVGRGNAFGHDRGSRARDLDLGRSTSTASLTDRRDGRDRDIGRSFGDRRDGRDRSVGDRRDGDRRDGRDFARSSDDRRDGRGDRRGDRRDGRDSSGKNTLGNLNAAHASATARANASPNSMVGRIATYESQVRAALAIEDRTARNAAIIAAREQLAQAANKPLTERNIARVDSLLGIQGAPARLGAERRDFDRRDFDRRDFARASFDRRDFDRRDFDRRDRDFIRDLFDDRRDSRNDRREGRDFSGRNTLGNLNAAHASATARANASPNSMVGRIAAYETEMRAALAIEDRAARNAAIVAARENLAQAANKPLTERNIARVDSLLGIQGAPARLGAERRDFDRDRRDFDRRDLGLVSFDRRDRDFIRDLFDDRRDNRHGHRDGLGFGLGRGLGFGNLPADPARIDALAAALDARGDRRAAEIRTAADRVAAGIIAKADARAADLRARGATSEDPAKFEARAAAVQARGNALAAELISRADRRADLLTERVDSRVETLQAIAAYDRAMTAALALPDRTAQVNAITAARTDLRAAIDRPLSGRTIDRLDDRLGLDGTPSARSSLALARGSDDLDG